MDVEDAVRGRRPRQLDFAAGDDRDVDPADGQGRHEGRLSRVRNQRQRCL